MIPIVLFAIGLLARSLADTAFVGPAYPHSYYYVHVAERPAAGQGFTTDYVWNLDDIGGALPAAAVLPVSANAYWMPLTEVLQVPTLWLLGAGPLASGLPLWVIGAFALPSTT